MQFYCLLHFKKKNCAHFLAQHLKNLSCDSAEESTFRKSDQATPQQEILRYPHVCLEFIKKKILSPSFSRMTIHRQLTENTSNVYSNLQLDIILQ